MTHQTCHACLPVSKTSLLNTEDLNIDITNKYLYKYKLFVQAMETRLIIIDIMHCYISYKTQCKDSKGE